MEGKLGGTDAPPARRPVESLAATNARVRSGQAFHRWSAIGRSPTVPPSISALPHQFGDILFAFFASLRFILGCWAGSVIPLCFLGGLGVLVVQNMIGCGHGDGSSSRQSLRDHYRPSSSPDLRSRHAASSRARAGSWTNPRGDDPPRRAGSTGSSPRRVRSL